MALVHGLFQEVRSQAFYTLADPNAAFRQYHLCSVPPGANSTRWVRTSRFPCPSVLCGAAGSSKIIASPRALGGTTTPQNLRLLYIEGLPHVTPRPPE
jgi:hypothetical protein